MPGFWEWLDATGAALLNFRRPIAMAVGRMEEPPGAFVIGTAREFGTQGPRSGEHVSAPYSVLGKHLVLSGASGSGKSTTTHRLRDTFVAERINCVDIDFRGDGYKRAVKRLVAAAVPLSRVTLIDLMDREQLTPFNLLGYGPGDAQTRAAVMFNALRNGSDSWGVQLGADLRATLIALAEARGSLLDVTSLLAPGGSDLRQQLLVSTKDDYVREFLTTYEQLSPEVQRSRLAAVANKLDDYLHHPVLRASLGLKGAPDLRQMMDEPGHITLVALGADRNPHASLVGRMLVGAIQRSAMARVEVDEPERKPCRLIVDESQNLLGEESCEILSEARRFGLGLILCCQYFGQLPAILRSSVKVNSSTQLAFQTGSTEATDIAGEVVSSLSRDEVRKTLLMAPVGCAVVLRRGMPSAFVTTPDSPDPEVDEDEISEYITAAKARTTVPRQEAEAALAMRSSNSKSKEVRRDVRKPFNRDKS